MRKNIKKVRLVLTNISKAAIFLFVILISGFGHRVSKKEIWSDLNKQQNLLETAVLLNNASQHIPLIDLSSRKIASIAISDTNAEVFDSMLRNYCAVKSFKFNSFNKGELNLYNTLIVHLSAQSLYLPEVISFLQENAQYKEVIITAFGPLTALQKLDHLSTPIIWNAESTLTAARYSAQVIFGGLTAYGKLPQTISTNYVKGAGYTTQKIRLSYVTAQDAGVSTAKLNRIDDILYQAIAERATPGAVVMVVKDGNVLFNKAYGSHTYNDEVNTKTTDIFDIASVTKIAATTMAAMKLYDEHKLNLNAGIGNYLSDVRGTDKNDIPVKDVLLHQAGFINLDFFSYLKPQDHSADSSFFYPVKIADNYYVRKDFYHDVMWAKMLRSPLPTKGQYVYSDISMYMMKEIIEHQAGATLDKYVADQFYTPLGMHTAGFNPRKKFAKDVIVPTERDTYFRKTLLQGYVHDSGASLASGVSGHAGLFASANDLAILNQMLLNGGTYGGVEYFKPETVQLFTSKQSAVSRRGLGFDRSNGSSYPCKYASPETFGHTGYTGTCVWTDPKEKLIYIFLSNRVYPSASNKLNSLRIRPRIQDAIYEAIANGKRSIASN